MKLPTTLNASILIMPLLYWNKKSLYCFYNLLSCTLSQGTLSKNICSIHFWHLKDNRKADDKNRKTRAKNNVSRTLLLLKWRVNNNYKIAIQLDNPLNVATRCKILVAFYSWQKLEAFLKKNDVAHYFCHHSFLSDRNPIANYWLSQRSNRPVRKLTKDKS